jgi:Zn-finger nucleic acid-binding protein
LRKTDGTYRYLGPGSIVIDTCHTCDLIWLEFGELNKVVNAPGRDRGLPRVKPKELEEEKKEGQEKKRSVFEQAIYDLLESFFS